MEKTEITAYVFHFIPEYIGSDRKHIYCTQVQAVTGEKIIKTANKNESLSYYRRQINIEELNNVVERYGSYQCVMLTKDREAFRNMIIDILKAKREKAIKEAESYANMILMI